jgi:glutathione S-transferase
MSLDPWHIFTANFGEVPKPYTAFATLLDMVMYLVVTFNVGRARKKYKVEVPRMDGPEGFLRVFRVQMNTLEQLAFHLPLLWIAAYAMDDVFAAMLGLIWFFGRILYAVRYYQKTNRRHKGFMIAMFANGLLLIGAFAGTMASF